MEVTGKVMPQPLVEIRAVAPHDAEVVAGLHAESWRDTYRGMLADAYLDGDLFGERRTYWRGRLADPAPGQFGFLAFHDSTAVGFVFALPHADPRWGTHLNNLHVRPTLRGGGVGRRLLHALTSHVRQQQLGAGLFLWVYEANVRTRAFYERLGAQPIERAIRPAPDGGTVAEWRYAWPDIDVLHTATGTGC